MPTLAELKAALTDPAYYRQVGGGLLDAYNRGAVGGLLGTPVDMANGVLNAGKMAAGYIGHQTGLLSGDQMPQPDMMPVGGSEWIGQKMQDAGMVSPNRNVPAEMLAGLAGIPLTAMAAAKAGPMVEKGIGQAMANAQMPSTLNMPQYSGQRGAIAYHGSPHKFDKFKTEAIGTGEGAQAYGHGIYLAEHPDVANEYATKLSAPVTTFGGKQINEIADPEAKRLAQWIQSNVGVMQFDARNGEANRLFNTLSQKQQSALGKPSVSDAGQLYKTDIPDEAVARFLDWDKPLSQQAPEVQAALAKYGIPDKNMTGQEINSYLKEVAASQSGKTGTMPSFYQQFGGDASRLMQEAGVPGIRYLDGGSRSTGAGTSNYVAFYPEMIRILERNGQPTGLLPWQPGEWGNK